MKLPLFLLFLLAPSPHAAVLPDDHFRSGEAALADELWEVAAIHFGELLQSKTLAPAEKSRAAIDLAEAWVRGGQPKKALDLLAEPFVAGAPGFHFWKGQALAGLDRLPEAIKELTLEIDKPDSTCATEAAFTRAALVLSQNQPDEALALLHPLAASPDPAISVGARLREVEILLDLQRAGEARQLMPAVAEVTAAQIPLASFLEASLLLNEKKSAEAAERFAGLLAQPAGQTLARHHAAALGYADAIAAQGDPAKASDSLLVFLQKHPDSPMLDAIFKRLIDWLPAAPAPNDPVLDRLTQWIPPPALPVTDWIATNGTGTIDRTPAAPAASDLAVYAIYARAIGLHRIPNAVSRAEARRLLTRLELDYPQHVLTPRALLQSARWLLDEKGNASRAFAVLDAVRETSGSVLLSGEASFLKARDAYQAGNLALAIQLFDEAAKTLGGPAAKAARLNAALSRYRKGEIVSVALISAVGNPTENSAFQVDLELEQALATTPPLAARAAIEAFLTRHPTHPRVPEARLAAAEAALSTSPPDLSMARAQLDTIAADAAAVKSLPPARLALARLRLTDLGADPAATIAAARDFLTTFPADPSASEASLTLGRNLFQTENYNDARLVLEKLAASDTDLARAQAAWLIAARSAALVATPQSRDEALILFDRAAAAPGTLGPVIMMEKARLMIDLNRLPEAREFLRKWYDSLPPADPLRLPSGLLFGEATYAQGSKNPQSLNEALAIYDQLLKHPETQAAFVNRIQYLRGMTLEQLPSPTNPAVKREGEALAAYYSVLNNAGSPPAEWHFLERSGFRALEILEKAERWSAAVAIAKKIASFKGPRAEEAATRARQLQLKYMMYDE
jgi:tetratricopeptide (TPR) repeat protein